MILLDALCVDNPMMLYGQAAATVALFTLYFALRLNPLPLPQLVLGLAILMLANLTARAFNADWFYITDIALFWLLALVIGAATVSIHHRRTQEKTAKMVLIAEAIDRGEIIKEVEIPINGFFDRWQNQITWGVGIICLILLGYAHTQDWTAKQQAKKDAEIAALKKDAENKAELARQQKRSTKELEEFKAAIYQGLAELFAANEKILNNQSTGLGKQDAILKGQRGLNANINNKSAISLEATRKMGNGNIDKKEPIKKRVNDAEPEDTHGFWERWFKNKKQAINRGDTLNNVEVYRPVEVLDTYTIEPYK